MRYNTETFKCDHCGKEQHSDPYDGWSTITGTNNAAWYRLTWDLSEGKRHIKDLCSYRCLCEFVSRDSNGPIDNAEHDINLENNATHEKTREEEALQAAATLRFLDKDDHKKPV
jgi:hypothetical protein